MLYELLTDCLDKCGPYFSFMKKLEELHNLRKQRTEPVQL